MTTDTPAIPPDDQVEDDHPYGKRSSPRVVYDEVTGYPVVTARPGAPIVTNEQIRRELEDFP